MPLQTNYRPDALEEMIGNDEAKLIMKEVLARPLEKIPHTFLLYGGSGCGKTTLAFIIRNILGVQSIDTYYYNAANTRGIDTARAVEENMWTMPMLGKRKIYIFDECHQITGAAQEGFLRPTESPPDHVFFVFCTTNPERLKDTLKRRCHKQELRPILMAQMAKFLRDILIKEKIPHITRGVISKIIAISDGSPGKALGYLDSIKEISDETIAIRALEDVSVREATILEICRALADGKTVGENKFKTLLPKLQQLTGEPENNRYAIIGYFKKILLSEQANDRIVDIMHCFYDSYIYTGDAKLISDIYMACKY